MSHYVTRLIPYEGYETDALEGWLEDMANRGFLLESITFCFARFKKGTPCHIRFRIDPHQRGSLEENGARGAQLKEMGWEHVTLLHGTLYQTTDQHLEFPPVSGEGAPISPSRQGLGTLVNLFLIYVIVIGGALRTSPSAFLVDWTEIVHTYGLELVLSELFLVFALLMSLLIKLVSVIQLRRREQTGTFSSRTFHTLNRAKRRTAARGILVASFSALFIMLALAYHSNTTVHDIPLTEYNGVIPFPLMEEINAEEWKELLSELQSEQPETFVENYLLTDSNFLAPVILMTRQYGPSVLGDDGFYRSHPAYTVNYYKLASVEIASKLFTAHLKNMPYEPISSRNGVQAVHMRNGEEQDLLLRYNTVVITVWYSGSTDLRNCMPLFETYLN